jgi:acyl-CoA hydrolase
MKNSTVKSKPAKSPVDSFTMMNEIVLPNDTNTLGNLMGGRLLHWMDICAAIAAQKHSNQIVVTASVDSVSFNEAIRLGDVVTLKAWVSRAFNTSMEVFIEVFAENIPHGESIKCNEAYYTFVALDSRQRPVTIPELVPETEEHVQKYDGALRRRQIRLILAGRMKPKDATELKNLFV